MTQTDWYLEVIFPINNGIQILLNFICNIPQDRSHPGP